MNREQKLIVFVAVLASLLEIIDTSIVNVAIPSMMGNLGATLEDVSMVVTGYAIANAIILPVSAWLGDRFGRRPYYLGCIAIFTITSVACGFAPNLPTLIIFRIFQGLAGGALLPTSQALIYEQFPKEKAGMAGALFGMSVMVGPTLGPVLGGYLTDQFGWRSIFNVNLPLGIFALFLGYVAIKNVERPPEPQAVEVAKAEKHAGPVQQTEKVTQPKAKRPIDAIGLILVAIGIGALQYTLERGEADDWFASKAVLICTIAFSICLPTFVWWELKVKDPIMNLRLFKDPIVANGVMLMTMVGFFLYAIVFILPIFINTTLHFDATQTGLLFIPGALVTVFLMPMIGKAMQTVDARILISIGFSGMIATALTFAQLSTDAGSREILTGLYIRGFAMAFLFVPINSSILSQFKGINLGQVSGLMNLSRQIGGGIGIALVGTLLNMNSHQNYVDISSKVSMLDMPTQAAVRQLQGGMAGKFTSEVGQAGGQVAASVAAMKALTGRIQAQVFMLSFNQLMYTIAGLCLLGFIPVARIRFRSKPIAVADSH